jgi:hypothetical protein
MNNNNNNKFDPFGAPTKAQETASFGFDANFANFDAFNDAKPADFENNNKKNSLEKPKSKEIPSQKLSKFASDYSDKEIDLEAVLRRSVLEQ